MGLCLSSVLISPIEEARGTTEFNLKIRERREIARGPTLNNLLFVKDKNGISDKAYQDLKLKCFLPIPSLFALKKSRSYIDSKFELHSNKMGVFLSIKEKIKFRLGIFFNEKYGFDDQLDDEELFKDQIVHIKFCADGTNIGRNLKLLNFTFTIINEGIKSKQASGNYTIGIFEIEHENYASLSAAFKEFIVELENLNEIDVEYQQSNKKRVKLVYYLGGDWKMLANTLGIMCANSKYPCVWCKCGKEDFYDLDKEYSISDAKMGARTHEEHAAILNHPDHKKILKYGYDKQPIFKDIIPNSRYMIDMLHLFLRISDTLFNLLVKDCSLADNFDMSAISKFDISKYKHMNSLQHFLNDKCNVKFTFLWIAETKKLNWRDLVGPEKIRMFENLNLKEVIPDHEKFKSVNTVWTEFYSIMQLVKLVEIEAAEVKRRTRKWLQVFLTVYNKATVTPYMHAFVQHLHEFIHLYKDINAFNCQGLEKLNDMTTNQFFKGTNKSENALHQILKKRNRMEYLATNIDKWNKDDTLY